MKKATLTIGLFSLMMVLTSFKSPEIGGSRGSETRVSDIIIGGSRGSETR